jgi:hypothetical protein
MLCVVAQSCSAQGVAEFGPLRIGGRAPIGPGEPTSYPYKFAPRSRFYVLVVQKNLPTMCVDEECGKHGLLVRARGGWITGDDQAETIEAVGLSENGVLANGDSIVVLADAKARIVGIYPGLKSDDIKKVLELHPQLTKRVRTPNKKDRLGL